MRFLFAFKVVLLSSIVNILLVFVPIGIAVHFANMPAGVVFGMNAIAIVPLAGLLSYATQTVACRLGDTVGALMNVTFGNAVELIIFIIALVKNHIRIVQASLVGSILVNLLLILGMSFLLGGLRFREQIYNSTVTQMSASLLALSVTSLILPTAFHASFSNEITADYKVLQVSRGTSVIILVVYCLYLVFQLKSHAYIYTSTPQDIVEREAVPGPAAQYFNPSASDSSSTLSDSDGSSPPARRSRRHRRVVRRGKTIARSVTLNRDTNADSETLVVSPVSSRSAGTGSIDSLDITASGNPIIADEDGESSYPQSHKHQDNRDRRKPRYCRQHNLRDTSSREAPKSSPERVEDKTGRFDFAVAPALEAQQKPRPQRPLSILALRRPSIFTARGLAPDPASPAPGFPHLDIRRTRSEPINRHSNCRHSRDPTMPPMIPPSPYTNNTHQPRTSSVSSPQPGSTPDSAQAVKTPAKQHPPTSRTTAVLLLLLSTALVAVCAEFMISAIDQLVATDPGLSEAFIGLILLPLVGNAAEHVTAVSVALQNKMDLAIGVAVGSSIQIALFVTPLVVILGWVLGKDMSLFFTLFETVCVFVSAFIVNFLVLDGRSNYLEGALLCAGYVIIAVAAFFYPDIKAANALGGGS
ncbi:Sodium/calcium exchanger protein-domain-containing protein [Chaetomidium leptoderma]|uniref:Sodium/calcium exchanger protein-domain-containing protein n=1 Tax=Chaetomidium leptoderma TaxID=669021 RepID=A0AAN6ZZL3_9PEZI|nr:Sodium/calcium exchanger protein-domain-containing protein [Chaetomidium leptoderma]